MRLIIAIDILGGKCVRLSRGDYASKTIYNEHPLEVAKEIEASGIKYLHLVDLDGAKSRKIVNYRILEQISAKTKLKIDFGGGIRTEEDINIAFSSGAQQVTGGSIAVSSPALFMDWLTRFGNEKIILGADFINRKIVTSGWLEKSEEDIISFIAGYAEKGVRYTICTDVDKDGMLMGPSTVLYKEVLESVNINLIASGGITSLQDIEDLSTSGCEGSIIGKAVYEGKIKLKDLRDLC
jgi:phosphoribosylformimino-5-aminoimidazole carboxamide ribotide isomerase